MRPIAKRYVLMLVPSAALAVVGSLGWVLGLPTLVPSLGPTLAMQAMHPSHASARAYAVVVGHCVGLAAALVALWLTGASDALPVSSGEVEPVRIAAACVAVAVSIALQQALGASHPPAESTTLLVALGSIRPELRPIVAVLVGVAVVALLGETARRIALGSGDPAAG